MQRTKAKAPMISDISPRQTLRSSCARLAAALLWLALALAATSAQAQPADAASSSPKVGAESDAGETPEVERSSDDADLPQALTQDREMPPYDDSTVSATELESTMQYDALPPLPPPPPADHPRNLITTDPFDLLYGIVSVEYERGIIDQLSVFFGPEFILYEGIESYEGNVRAYGASFGARVFPIPGSHAPEGFWLSPEFSVLSAKVDDSFGESEQVFAWSAAGLVGFTSIFGKPGFALSGGLGVGYLNASTNIDGIEYGYKGVGLAGRLGLGVGF